MKDWLHKLAQEQRTPEDELLESLESLPASELQKLAEAFDPSQRPTMLDVFEGRIADADRMGRQLAHEQPELEKVAFIGSLMAQGAKMLGGAGGKALLGDVAKGVAKDVAVNKISGGVQKAMSPMASSAPGAAAGAFKYANVGMGGMGVGGISAPKSTTIGSSPSSGVGQPALPPMGTGGGTKMAAPGFMQQAAGYLVRHPGAAVTAAGAGVGALMAPRDPQTGEKQYLRGAMYGGGIAAGANALSGGGIAQKARSAVMNPKSPLLGQKTRQYAMDAARATKGSYPPGGAAAAAAPVAAAQHSAGPVMSSAPAANAGSPGLLQRVRNYFKSPVSTAGAATAPSYAGGPVGGHVGLDHGIGPVMGTAKVASMVDLIIQAGLEKKAYAGIDDLLGLAIGLNKGRKQHDRGEEHTFGGKQVGSLLLPGGIGYQIGRGIGHSQASKEKKAGLPSYLKNMTKLEGGVTKVTQWPKDKRLVKRLEMHQAGKQLPLAPGSRDPGWMEDYRAAHANPRPGSQIDAWKKNRETLKTANQQTLTYDPATKTFTRQHMTADTTMGPSGNDMIPAGHTEPVVRNAGPGTHMGQAVPASVGPSGGAGMVHSLPGGVMSSSPAPGVASRPRAVPPPIPPAARRAGPIGLAGAAARPTKLPSLSGAVSLAGRR